MYKRQVQHKFPGLAAWLIKKGHVVVTGNGVQIDAEPGNWVFPPFKTDTRNFSDDIEILSIRFEASWGGDNELYQESTPYQIPSEDYPQLEKAALRLLKVAGTRMTDAKNEMKFVQVDIQKHVRIQQSFLAWIQHYIRVMDLLKVSPHRVNITDSRVREARDYLDASFLENSFRESLLAKKVGLSVAQLNRLFLKDIGVTPSAYFTERKLRAAKRELINTQTPIKQIGYELGFNDPSNFTNWFQSKTQHSPKEYRRLASTHV